MIAWDGVLNLTHVPDLPDSIEVFLTTPLPAHWRPTADGEARYGAARVRLKRLSGHTRMLIWMIKAAIKAWKSHLPGIDKIHPPSDFGHLPLKRLPFSNSDDQVVLPTEDEDWPDPPLSRLLMLALLRNGFLFPMRDRATHWVSRFEGRDAFQEIFPLGVYLSRPYHYWDEMRSDAAMSRIAFAGLGAFRLERFAQGSEDSPTVEHAQWVSDLTYMSKYEVRRGFEHYGAAAYFDEEQRPIAIYWCHTSRWVTPRDPDWEHAKWVWRCTLLVATTVTDHLVRVHWLIGNYVTTASRVHLSPSHYLRRLLKPFTWRTVTINDGASDSLLPRRGFVHRAAALTHASLSQAFRDSIHLARFETVPEMAARKRATDMGDRFPWMTDALALYKVIHDFVDDYIQGHTGPQALIEDAEIQTFWEGLYKAPNMGDAPALSARGLSEMLAQFIWSVTGLHEAVGTVHEYVLDPTFTGTKIRPGTEMADVQASIQNLCIIALTGLEMPQLLDLGDASHIVESDTHARQAFARFHRNLIALSERNDAANERRLANKERPWPCNSFNPRVLETGVSI